MLFIEMKRLLDNSLWSDHIGGKQDKVTLVITDIKRDAKRIFQNLAGKYKLYKYSN